MKRKQITLSIYVNGSSELAKTRAKRKKKKPVVSYKGKTPEKRWNVYLVVVER